jgi:hypothetical protein
MIVLVLIVVLLAIFLVLSSFVGAILLLKIFVFRGAIRVGGGGRGILLGVPVVVAGVSSLRNGEVDVDVLGLFEVITLIVIHCLLIYKLLLVI